MNITAKCNFYWTKDIRWIQVKRITLDDVFPHCLDMDDKIMECG